VLLRLRVPFLVCCDVACAILLWLCVWGDCCWNTCRVRGQKGHNKSGKKQCICWFNYLIKNCTVVIVWNCRYKSWSFPCPCREEGEVQLHSFLASALDGGQRLNSRPNCHIPHKQHPQPLTRSLCGSRAHLNVLEIRKNLLPLPAFEPRTVQSVAYTDYATAAQRCRYFKPILCWTSLRYIWYPRCHKNQLYSRNFVHTK
jgi:hypothetical protein